MKLFLSFNKADVEFARWIAWNVERSGCEVVFQEWDFGAGTDFVEQMRRGLEASDKLIAVLSPAYLAARFTHPEWYEFFRRDPTGEQGLLVPVRVAECDPGPLLQTRIYVDLFGCEESEARRRLLAAVRGERRKPKRAPRFPQVTFPASGLTPAHAVPVGGSSAAWRADGRNLLEVLADLYHLARGKAYDLVALPTHAENWERYHGLRADAGRAMAVDAHLRLRLRKRWPDLEGKDTAALAALLAVTGAACASRIAEMGPAQIRTRAEMGAVGYWVAGDDTPFAGDFPRHTEEVAATLESLYLPDIRLIPAECDGFELKAIGTLPPSTRGVLRECRMEKRVRVALSSLGVAAAFAGEALPGFPAGEPARFRLTGMENGAAEQENLLAILGKAAAEAASILVLPELRVTPAMEGAIQEFLAKGRHSLALVVAGSWHHASADGGWENRSSVLGARGEVVWQHRKLREYRATAANVAAAPEFFTRIGVGEDGGFEGIQRGRVLEYCDTPIGRLCVAICVGFFHPEVRPALAATRADYFLVPAMTPRTEDLQRAAEELARECAATLVANCGVVGREKAPSFWRKPLKNEMVARVWAPVGFIDFTLR